MTDSSDATTADEQRRQEILSRTRMGLHDDLDDLRDELGQRLEDFESRLQRTAKHLPLWLDLPEDSMRAPFELTEPVEVEGALIGPRCVAVVAAEVEDFLFDWLGDEGDIPAWQKRNDEDAIDRLDDDLENLARTIETCHEAVEALADDGPLQLEQILESIVFELETRRETDVEALESLIQSGDVAPGRNAREEIAEIWEEQRRRVDELQRVWDDLLNLHSEGVNSTLDGLEELAELTTQARQGIEGASVLEPREEVPPNGDEDLDEDAGDGMGEEPGDELVDDEAPPMETRESLGAESSGEVVTNPFLRTPSEVEEVQAQKENRDSAPSGDIADNKTPTKTETDGGDRQAQLIDMGPTTPIDADGVDSSEEIEPIAEADTQGDDQVSDEPHDGRGANLELFGATVPDASQPEKDAATTASEPSDGAGDVEPDVFADDAQGETVPDSHRAGETLPMESPSPSSTDEARDSTKNGPHRESETPSAQVSQDSGEDSDEEDLLRLRTFRIRDGWQTVTGDEIAATLGLPALFVASLLALCILSLFDVTENPMELWEWAFPASLFTMGLLVLLPLALRWHPMWRGTRFRVIRRGDVEEEVDLRVTADRQLVVDRTSFDIDELQAVEVSRWDSRDGQTRGWLLTVEPPYHGPVHLITLADEVESWLRAPEPLVNAPGDAWQIPPEEFDELCAILDR